MGALIQTITIAVLLFLGFSVGGWRERKHLRELTHREEQLSDILVTNTKKVVDPQNVQQASLVMGQVVIATDYFKTFVTTLRNLVGGEMVAARSLMLRARREALLRLLEQARQSGATEVHNVRFEFCNISQMSGKRGAMQVEIVAYGTAVSRASAADS